MNIFKTIRVLSCLMLLSVCTYGQESNDSIQSSNFTGKKNSLLEIGISSMAYRGNLQPGFYQWNGGFKAGLQLNEKHRWNGHFGLVLGMVKGQNPDLTYAPYELPKGISPNKFFQTFIVALNYDLQFNIIKTPKWRWYLGQGIGLTRFEPMDQDYKSLNDQRNTRAPEEDYSIVTFFFPTTVGLWYKLPNNYAFGIQGVLFNPATDYIDNTSELSPNERSDNVLMLQLSMFVPLSSSSTGKK